MSAFNSLRPNEILVFGRYRLRRRERVLEKDGAPLAIAEKTLDVLCALVESRGQIVERETLMRKVWPDTFVEDSNIAFQISTLRKLLDESANSPRFIATVPKRGYRFIAEVLEETETQTETVVDAPTGTPAGKAVPEANSRLIEPRPERFFRQRWMWAAGGAITALAVLALMGTGTQRKFSVLAERGTVVLAEFENKTGDAVFDGTLRQGLLVALEQSPFLSILSERRLQRTLTLMRQPPTGRLTHEIAMSICERTGSAMVVEGSIERIGRLYVLGLRAWNCDGGGLVDAEQAKAGTKESVLDALSEMAVKFRRRVGEAAATLKQHNISLAEATTEFPEALNSYSMGWALHQARGAPDAIPLLKHAVEIDPQFAMAHAALGRMYADIDESDLAAQSLKTAWELKEHTSDRERFFIEVNYLSLVTGNLAEARSVADAWARTYPNDAVPHTLLSGLPNKAVARYEEAASQARRSIQIDPDFGMSYYNLAVNSLYLQRLDDAGAALAAAAGRGLEIDEFHMLAYDLAFLRGDTDGVEGIVARERARSLAANWIENREAFRLTYAGRLQEARRRCDQAVAAAEQAGQTERAAAWKAGEAVREAMAGNRPEARRSAAAAMQLSHNREVRYGSALALAMAADTATAQTIASGLEKEFPEDTSIRFSYVPVVRAQIELKRHNPAGALEVLKVTVPTEMGVSRSAAITLFGALYPIYFRGLALCDLGRGKEAVDEFRKIVGHSGLVVSDPVGALAHLQMARAYRIAGDRTSAKAAYEEFLRLWRNADANLELLRDARSEYALLIG